MTTIIGSTGKFGVSMDCSQRTEIRRKYLNANAMFTVNPQNQPNIKPYFNQDKRTRNYGDNGAKDYYFGRGLQLAYKLAF